MAILLLKNGKRAKEVTLSTGRVVQIPVDDSPGWDAFLEKESKLLEMRDAGQISRKYITDRWHKPIPVDELLKSLNEALTIQGWSVDISPSISADDRRGFVISILEPANVKDKKD